MKKRILLLTCCLLLAASGCGNQSAEREEDLPCTLQDMSYYNEKRLEFLMWKSSLNLSGQQDLNLRPHGPQPCALPSYAIPRNQQMLLYQNFFKNQHFFRKFFGLEPKYFRKAPEKCSGEEYPRALDTEVTVWPGCPRRTRARSIRA